MGEVDEIQEKMKANMEAMMSMRKMIEVNAVAVATIIVATEVDPTHPSGLNQESSSLGYGRAGRRSVRKFERPPFCANS